MNELTLEYRHNTDSHRGLAATGVFLIKILLVAPHAIVVNILQNLTMLLGYIGYWVVALTGSMPQATHRLADITFGWQVRTWSWFAGIVDVYPPFETDPDYPVALPAPKPEDPNRGWAIAGIVLVKLLALIPHLIVLLFLGIGGVIAMWIGFVVALFTGSLPTGLQDFFAGVMQWIIRVQAWAIGITDEYPPFSLEAHPSD